jgi:hypothetical protein
MYGMVIWRKLVFGRQPELPRFIREAYLLKFGPISKSQILKDYFTVTSRCYKNLDHF